MICNLTLFALGWRSEEEHGRSLHNHFCYYHSDFFVSQIEEEKLLKPSTDTHFLITES